MEYDGRLQVVVMVSLLLVALVGSIGSFAGVAAADGGSIFFDDSSYADGDTVTVTVEDGDLSTTEEYVVNVQSDTEGQVAVTGERPGSSSTYTTDVSVADENNDNKITKSDIEYEDRDTGGNQITSLSRNENGTVTITFQNSPGTNDALYYTRGETVALTHSTGDKFVGSTQVSSTDSIGTLHVAEGDTINASYFDNTESNNLTTTAIINNDPEPLSLGPVTEFSTGSLNGTALTHTASVIEIPFSEDVSKAGGASGELTLGGNVTVRVDGENVTDRYALDADGSVDGQVVVTSATPVDPGATVAIAIDAVNDSADAETIAPGTVEVTVTDASASEGGDADAYDNETVAFVAAEPNRAFDVSDSSDALAFAGRTGAGSQVFAFDTGERNWSGAYTIESTDSGGVVATTDVTVRDLGLAVDVADRNVTTTQGIDARISAVESGRDVEATLVTADGAVVDRRNLTTGGNGDVTVEFDGDPLVEAGPGNYTVNVTDGATAAAVDSGRIRVLDPDERTAAFRSSVVAEHAGDVATLDLELRYADAATVTVGSPEVGFRANVTVEDRDDDGTVRLRFNTAAAASATTVPDDGGDVFATAEDGNASGDSDTVVAAGIDDSHAASGALDPDDYGLAVRPGPGASAAETDVGTLVVREPAPQRLDTWVAPANATFSTTADVSAAVEAGRLTDADEVAVGDVVVHRIVAPGIAGELAKTPDDTTEAFFGLAGTESGDLYGLNVTQRDPGANEDPYRLRLNETTANVVADATNDTYFVIYRSDAPDAVPWNGTAATGPPDPDAPAAGDSLSAAFTVHPDGPFAERELTERRVAETHSLLAARIGADGPVVVTNATNQSISGRTTLAPGSAFDLRIRSANGTDPQFLKTARAVVGADGRWNASVDFDGQRVGETFTVRSAADTVNPADELAVDGEIRANLTTNTPTPTAEPTTTGTGGSGGRGGGGDDDDRDRSTPSPTTAATPTPSPDDSDSVVDSAQQFLGEMVGTTVDDTDAESIRERLFNFDVAVPALALTAVVVYVTRRG
jgi:hypothetical protein